MHDDQFDEFTRAMAEGVSRRQLLKYLGAGLVTGLASLVGVKRLRGVADETQTFTQVLNPWDGQVVCPACGICNQCSVNLAQQTGTCGDCSQPCQAAALCAAANRNKDHQLLVHHLKEAGFVQNTSIESDAFILNEDGSRVGSGVTTHFIQSNTDLSARIDYFEIDIGEFNREYYAFALILQGTAPLQEHYIDQFGQLQTILPPAPTAASVYPDVADQANIQGFIPPGKCHKQCWVLCDLGFGWLFCKKWSIVIGAAAGSPGGLPGAVAGAKAGYEFGSEYICDPLTNLCREHCRANKCCQDGGYKCDDDTCPDLNTDRNNCGRCGNRCGEGCTQCLDGSCASGCPSGTTCCDGQCCHSCCCKGELCTKYDVCCEWPNSCCGAPVWDCAYDCTGG